MDTVDELLSIRAAELYYEEDKTQDEIGSILRSPAGRSGGCWRRPRRAASSGSRSSTRARVGPRRAPPARERGSQRSSCPRAGVDDDELQPRTAQAAADYLATLRPVPRTLGISWGRTLDDVAAAPRGRLGERRRRRADQRRRQPQPPDQARRPPPPSRIAQKAGGHATLLPSPAILERLETKRAIESDRAVAARARPRMRAPTPTCSAPERPTRAPCSSTAATSPPTTSPTSCAAARSATWSAGTSTPTGAIVDERLDERTIGLPLESLRAATAQRSRSSRARPSTPSPRAVVASGLCTVLVTDEETARAPSSRTTAIRHPTRRTARHSMTGTQIVARGARRRAPGRRGERRQPASLPARHPRRRRRRARAAGRRARHPLDQDHLEGVGARPHHRADRPDHPRGRRHARQGALARREGGDPRRRPTRRARASPRSACTATWCRTRCRRSARRTATRTRARSPSPRSPPRSRAAAPRGRSSSRTPPTRSPRAPTRSTWSSTAGRSSPAATARSTTRSSPSRRPAAARTAPTPTSRSSSRPAS